MTSSTTVRPAVAQTVAAQPALPFAGNTQLSRSALTTNVVAPRNLPSLSQIGLASNVVGVTATAPSGNTGVPGLGFTRYIQNPRSLASLGLFPVRYEYSSAITRRADQAYYEKENLYRSLVSNDNNSFLSESNRGSLVDSVLNENYRDAKDLTETTLLESNGSRAESEVYKSIIIVEEVENVETASPPTNAASSGSLLD